MSGPIIDALGGGLGSIAGAGLGELAGGLIGIDPSITEAIGGALGGGLGAGLTSKSVTGGLLGAAGGALAGPAALGGIESLSGGSLSNLFGPGVGVGGAGAPLSLGGVSPASAPPTGGLSPSGGLSAAGAVGGDIGSVADVNAGLQDPNSPFFVGAGDPNAAGGGGFNLGNFLSQNKSWLLPAAGLAVSALEGNQQTPAQGQQSALGAQQQQYAGQLEAPLITGNLPPGAQAQVQQSLEAQEAAIRSQFAGLGLTGSTMETEALNSARQSSVAQTFQIASNMASQGLAAAGQAGTIDQQMVSQQLQQDKALQDAIASFSAAAAGGGYYPGGYPGYVPYGYVPAQQQPVA